MYDVTKLCFFFLIFIGVIDIEIDTVPPTGLVQDREPLVAYLAPPSYNDVPFSSGLSVASAIPNIEWTSPFFIAPQNLLMLVCAVFL